MLGLVSTEDRLGDLFDAMSINFVTEVERLLQLPLDPNADRFLTFSTRSNIEIMQLLLEARADPNGGVSEHWPPLCEATLHNAVEAVSWILSG